MKIFLKCLVLVCSALFCVYIISLILDKIHHEAIELDSIAFQEEYATAVRAINLMQPYLDAEQKNALEQRILEIESAGIPARGKFCSDSFAGVLQDMVLENCCWANKRVEALDVSCEHESESIKKILAPVPREKVWQLSWEVNSLHFSIHQNIESFPDLERKETIIYDSLNAIEELFAKK